MSYTNIYRIDPNKVDYATYYSSDYSIFGQFSSSGTGPIPPLYTPPELPQFLLSPGIVHGEQILGRGQSLVLRLLTDISSHPYGNINVSQMYGRVNFTIDANNNLNISCISGARFPQRDISNISLNGKKIVTMIFNIFDSSGLLTRPNQVSLNFTREVTGQQFNINDSTIFEISGTTLLEAVQNRNILYTNTDISYLHHGIDYTIEISNNQLQLSLTNINYNNYYLKKFSFNLCDTSVNYLLNSNDLNFYINSSTAYNLTNDLSFNFQIDFSNNNNITQNYIQLDLNNNVILGDIYIYNYNLASNVEYFNINQIEYLTNINNLISLTNNNYQIGEINRV